MNRNVLGLAAVGALLLGVALVLRAAPEPPAAPPAPEPVEAPAVKAPPVAQRAPDAPPALAPTPESGEAWGKHVRKLLRAAHEAQQQQDQAEPAAAEAPEAETAPDEDVDTGWYPDEVHAIDREGLQAAIRTAIPGMQQCYEGALQVDPELAGSVALSLTIAAQDDDPETGRVTQTGIEQSTLGQPFIEACLLQQVQPLAFEAPADGGSLQVTYPVRFAPE